MSASSSSFYRLAGLSYVRYANLCAEVLRASLKEPFLGKVRLAGCARVSSRLARGGATLQVVCDASEPRWPARRGGAAQRTNTSPEASVAAPPTARR